MSTTTSLNDMIDLFTAAIATDASVTLHERRTPGARAALVSWAALVQLAVVTTPISGGRHAVCAVELENGTEIKVIVRDVAQLDEARS